MPKITIIFGLLLCGMSALALILVGGLQNVKSPTMWIPMGFGVPLILLGAVAALKPTLRMHVMHAAVLVGLIGGLASLWQGISQLIKLANGQEVKALAAGMVWAMAVVCLAFVGMCVQSFIAARKQRENSSTPQ